MKFLLGVGPHNSHLQNIALALHEVGALGAYHTVGADHYRQAWLSRFRRFAEVTLPPLHKELLRRRIRTIPEEFIYSDWTWEGPRTLSSRLGFDERIQDWFW